jgi:phosphoglycolate phosphatase
MKKSLVIFDMDGTLIDSSRTIANSINHVRQNMGLSPMSHEQIISKVNDHSISPAAYFYEVDAFEPIHEQWFNEYYTQNHATELALYPGIYALLQWLHERGIKIALATNAYRISALESVRHFGIEPFFDAVACADDVRRGKPYPDMLFKILEVLDKTNEEAIFVGDGPRDEDASEAAYIDYLMVDWGFTEHGRDKSVIGSVAELQERLAEVLSQNLK